MLMRSSIALLLAVIFAAPSDAQFVRRAIEHRLEGNAVGAVACKSDAERLCPGVADSGGQRQCLKVHQNELSIPCAKELQKVERMSQ